MPRYSLLDLCPITEEGTAAEALQHSLDLARHAEKHGYHRYWLAEHHNMPGIASAATSVVIGHVAAGTSSIRVGAGGIMLPNHAPLVIAEQFGTLESLFPGRIDLGLGRAPGTDRATAYALRRNLHSDAGQFPRDVMELQTYLDDPTPEQTVHAVPGEGLKVPVWILGSSLFGAQLAAELGLPYAFASHFAPADLMPALHAYRSNFKPSPYCEKPTAMIGLQVVAADSDEEAEYLASSMQQMFIRLRTGQPGKLPPPAENYFRQLGHPERNLLEGILACAAIGSRDTVRRRISALIDQTGADELMITGNIYNHQARLKSFELAADVVQEINAGQRESA